MEKHYSYKNLFLLQSNLTTKMIFGAVVLIAYVSHWTSHKRTSIFNLIIRNEKDVQEVVQNFELCSYHIKKQSVIFKSGSISRWCFSLCVNSLTFPYGFLNRQKWALILFSIFAMFHSFHLLRFLFTITVAFYTEPSIQWNNIKR